MTKRMFLVSIILLLMVSSVSAVIYDNDPKLIGYWKLDDSGATLSDSKNNWMPKFNMWTISTGQLAQKLANYSSNSIKLDGSDDYAVTNFSVMKPYLLYLINYTYGCFINGSGGRIFGDISGVGTDYGFTMLNVPNDLTGCQIGKGSTPLSASLGDSEALNFYSICRYNGTTLSFWMNKTLKANAVGTSSHTGISNFIMGAVNLTGSLASFFGGQVDECFIYNDSMTAQNISDIYNLGILAGVDITSPSLTDNITNGTIMQDESIVFNMSVVELYPAYYRFFWNESGSYVNDSAYSYIDGQRLSTVKTITNSNGSYICWGYWVNDTSGNSNTASACFTVKNNLPIFYTNILNDTDLIGYWRLDESTSTMVDSKNNSFPQYNLGCQNALRQQSNIANYSAYSLGFNNVNSSCGGDSSLDTSIRSMNNTKGLTVFTWVRYNNFAYDYLIDWSDYHAIYGGYTGLAMMSWSENGGEVFCKMGNLSLGYTQAVWSSGNAKVYSMACKINSTGISIYINGTQRNYAYGKYYVAGINAFTLGYRNFDLEPSYYFDGSLDEIIVVNRSLTSADILSLHDSGTFALLDITLPVFSNNKTNGTIINGEVVAFNMTVTEENPAYYKFFWNASGSYVNDSEYSYADGQRLSTVKTIINTKNSTVCWGYWANDTWGNSNTANACFTVKNIPPEKPVIVAPHNLVDELNYIDINYTGSDYDGDFLIYKLYINGVLNSTSSSNITGWDASDGTYTAYVITNDGYSDSVQSDNVIFTMHIEGPDISVTSIDMSYNETYNDLPLNIEFTTDEDANCTLNSSYWSAVSDGGITHSFADTNATPEQFYSILIQCNDSIDNPNNATVYFTVDRTPPFLYTVNPDRHGNTSVYTLGSFVVDVSGSDNIALYSYIANITKFSDSTLMWSYSNTTISDESVNISQFSLYYPIDVSSWENTTYIYSEELCDAHTIEVWNESDRPDINIGRSAEPMMGRDGLGRAGENENEAPNQVALAMKSDMNVVFESVDDSVTGVDVVSEIDRIKPAFTYDDSVVLPVKTYRLSVENAKLYKYNSGIYAGWFIIDGGEGNRYWFDAEDGEGSAVDVEMIDENTYEIILHNPSNDITFSSIGPVNCISRSFNFNFKQPYAPIITVYAPVVYNQSVALGQSVAFDIEANDSNVEDILSYDWKVNGVTKATTEDFYLLMDVGHIGTVYHVVATVTDNSLLSLSNSKSFEFDIISGYNAQYQNADLKNIVINGIGSAGASVVGWTDLLVVLFIVLMGGIMFMAYGKDAFKTWKK